MRILDDYDEAVYAEAFPLAEATRRFLARVSTCKVIASGLLDADVVDDLNAANNRMQAARLARVEDARCEVKA